VAITHREMPHTPAADGSPNPTKVFAWIGTLGAAALAVALTLLLAAGFMVTAVGSATSQAMDLVFSPMEGDPDLAQLEQRSVVYASDGTPLAILHDEIHRRIVPLDTVPLHVRQAVIAAEDRRYYEHNGFDLEGITRAAVANLRERRVVQGGSTLTQQLAKQNFVGDDQTMERKLAELRYALALEEEFDKDELLERYLNQVYFGSGAYGVAAAAEEFFGIDHENLSVEQSALLAGVIRAPGSLDPRQNPDQAEARRNVVLAAMAEEGYLSADEAEQAQQIPVEVLPRREREVRDPYVIEAVKRDFFANPAFGEERSDRIHALFNGGLSIHTTINPRLQEIAQRVVEEAFPNGNGGPTAALAAVDPTTGRLLAIHSGADFEEEQFDLATQGRRQPGSAFKTFVLAAALEQGFPLSLQLEGNSGLEIDDQSLLEPWTIRNYGDSSYGTVDLTEAFVRSVNTAFAQLVMAAGVEETKDIANRLGIDIARASSDQDGPAISLGGISHGVTPLEMASAFGTIANAGLHLPPYLIERVENHRGEVVYERESEPQFGMDSAAAGALRGVMEQVVQRGTGTAAQLPGWPVAGKTGTTQNHADAWFVGAVPVLSTAVWTGHPEGQVSVRGMTGGTAAAPVWRAFMEEALDGIDPRPFLDTPDDLSHLQAAGAVDVPDVRRMDEAEALGVLAEARLVATVSRVPSNAPAGVVVWQSPSPGSTARPGEQVVIGVSTGTPPAPEPAEEPDDQPEPDDEPQPGDEPEPDDEPAPPAPPEPEPDGDQDQALTSEEG
jgi:penicillin-binding protein 1A